MKGAIGTWDILSHPVVTIRCFGWKVFFRACVPARDQTFLSLLQSASCFGVRSPLRPPMIDRCIRLELQAMDLYDALARRLTGVVELHEFLAELARQERNHAELLELCWAATAEDAWLEDPFRRRQDCLPRVEQQLQEKAAVAGRLSTSAEVVHLVLQIESAEINWLFSGIVQSASSRFVRKLRPFRRAVKNHIAYICELAPRLAPETAAACQELKATSPGGY